MTLWESFCFLMAIFGAATSLTVIGMCIISLLPGAKRWFGSNEDHYV